jgi:hypothetical protein
MSATPAPDLSSLPVGVQLAISAGFFLVAVIAGGFGFFKSLLQKPQAPPTLLITDAAKADLRPFMEMVEVSQRIHTELTRIADIGEAFLKLLQDEAQDREIEKRIAEEVKRRVDQTKG